MSIELPSARSQTREVVYVNITLTPFHPRRPPAAADRFPPLQRPSEAIRRSCIPAVLVYVHGSFCRKIAIWGPIPTTSTLGIKIDGFGSAAKET